MTSATGLPQPRRADFSRHRCWVFATVLLSAVIFSVPGVCRGQIAVMIATVEVTTLSDEASPAGCSLREAIDALTLGSNINGCARTMIVGLGADVVTFDPALMPGEIVLNSALEPAVDLFIRGPGRELLTISGQHAHEVFWATDAHLRIEGVTLTEGLAARPSASTGGAVFAREVTLDGVRVSNSTALDSGGGISGTRVAVRNSEIVGNQVAAGSGIGGGLSGSFVTIESSEFKENEAGTFGGAVAAGLELSISDSLFQHNRAATGGALYVVRGNGEVVRSQFVDNDGEGAVIYQTDDSAVDDTLRLSIRQSLIVDQVVNPFGGSLFAQRQTDRMVQLRVQNTSILTVRGIRAEAELSLNNVTIRAMGGASGLTLPAGSLAQLYDSIVVSDGPAACQNQGVFPAQFNNIFSSGNCADEARGDLVAEPMLGPLKDNGGPTASFAPLSGSPAINNGGPFCRSVDQRGLQRTDGFCDIGAIEFGAARVFDDGFE